MMAAGLSCFAMSSDVISGDTAQIPLLISQVLARWAVGMFWVAPPPCGVTLRGLTSACPRIQCPLGTLGDFLAVMGGT